MTGSHISENSIPLQTVQTFEIHSFVQEDLELKDAGGATIGLGMSKDELTQLIGNHVDTIDFIDIYLFEGLEIHYKNEKVNAILIRDNTPSNKRFKTLKGIGFGDSFSDVIHAYGTGGFVDVNYGTKSITYLFERTDEGNFRILKSRMDMKEKERFLSLSMAFDKNDNIIFLMIADYDFSYGLDSIKK
ncbi:hypothetical protein [Paenibacillus turpanensis]|uniref:hypothetical protein n=1 Tax=Paenibacillus turpanensis TaxID=2689078 RepID=UPI00140A2944|nr:hypothetical protein [Paenibacillus turpanensis]